MNEIISNLPEGCSRSPVSGSGFSGEFITLPASALRTPGGAIFQLDRPLRWVALHRYQPWWPEPVYGCGKVNFDGEFFMILWEREAGGYGVALPLVDGDVRGILNGTSDGLSLQVPTMDPLSDRATLLFVATGDDPVELVQAAVQKISERLGTFKMRTEKKTPGWVDYLGWCTWDAFYLDVTADKVLQGLASFQQGGCPIRMFILDGGWQDEKEGHLWSFRSNSERFPQGLKALVEQAKAQYGVKIFGVWHALEGYFNGIHPDGDLAGQYEFVTTVLTPEEESKIGVPRSDIHKRCMVIPSDISRFFNDYHRVLRDQGVDMVKVDNQASLDWTPSVPPTAAMRAYQYALQDSEQTYFQGESMHCMSNTMDIVYHLRSATVWRSSTDFYPKRAHFHTLHIFRNAISSIWVQAFGLPDWDMFQSEHPAGGFHAASRAISGGPIYVTDEPGHHDFGLLSKLMISDGRILRSKQPARPARDSIFEDGRVIHRVTKIVNFNEVTGWPAPVGVLGLFNCFYIEKAGPEPVDGEYCAADVPGISASRFALYHHTSGRVIVADATARQPVHLDSLGYEVVTVSALVEGVALFGLIDKFNGSRALESARWISGNTLELVLLDGGRIGWHSERAGGVSATLKEVPVKVTSQDGLSWVEAPTGEPVTLVLRFG